jgi:S-DNA-T family DNA segregation ATPase FtsK/SpoIIIE
METLQAMDGLIQEMERRLKSLAQHGVMNIHQLTPGRRPPYIVLVIDELADFMGKSADKEVSKLATAKLGLIVQRSRATGVHVIAATQRPSVDVVTGTVKSNFPARLSFRLPTEADSRTILGHSGAENLLSVGDCWYQSPLAPQTRRLHSYYATLQDITQCLELANSSLLPRGSLWKTPASVN